MQKSQGVQLGQKVCEYEKCCQLGACVCPLYTFVLCVFVCVCERVALFVCPMCLRSFVNCLCSKLTLCALSLYHFFFIHPFLLLSIPSTPFVFYLSIFSLFLPPFLPCHSLPLSLFRSPYLSTSLSSSFSYCLFPSLCHCLLSTS